MRHFPQSRHPARRSNEASKPLVWTKTPDAIVDNETRYAGETLQSYA
jgi:hypothetical protein